MDESQEKGLESLKVWQRALAFAKEVCVHVLPILPAQEKWCLEVQLHRSAQSIPANLAEGYGRYYYQDSIRFCYIARGSLEETYSQIRLAHELGYVPQQDYDGYVREIGELRRMINGYISYLKKSKRGSKEPGAKHILGEGEQDDYSIDILEP
ncbi:MAG: four helix bundle protein [Anaerolineales bacterium]